MKTYVVETPDGIQHLVVKQRIECRLAFNDVKVIYVPRTSCGLDRFSPGMKPVKKKINVNCALCLAEEHG